MKAIIVREHGGPEVLQLEETPVPRPSADQILVRVRAAGINPVDTYVRQGMHPSTPPLPFTPGKDGAGIVAEVGPGVTKVSPGERVYLAGSVTGTYAEYALALAEHVWPLPDNATFEQGAGIFVPYATAFRALFKKAGARAGETVLIHGASGAVGIAALQWAKNAGLRVFGTAGSAAGLELVRSLGADQVFDHTSADYLAAISEATGRKGVGIILEMLANQNLEKDFEVLAMNGRIIIIGNRGSLEFNPRLTMGKEATIRGLSLFNASAEEFEEIHAAIRQGLGEGYLAPVIGRSFPLAAAAEAQREVIENRAFGKIVLDIS